MSAQMKGVLQTVIVVLVTMAVVNRVPQVRSIVMG